MSDMPSVMAALIDSLKEEAEEMDKLECRVSTNSAQWSNQPAAAPNHRQRVQCNKDKQWKGF